MTMSRCTYAVRCGNILVHAPSAEGAAVVALKLKKQSMAGASGATADAGQSSMVAMIGPASNELLCMLVRAHGLQGKAAKSLPTALRVARVRAAFNGDQLTD